MSIEGWAGAVHPAAELFPLIEGDEFDQLVADIDANGLLEPVWVMPDGALLDGRNRVKACVKTSTPIQTRTYEGSDPIGFVLSLNLKRRHLTTGQRAMLALQVEALIAQTNKPGRRWEVEDDVIVADLPQLSDRERKSREQAAKSVGTSGRAVAQAKRIQQEAPDLAEKVIAGELALDKAEREVRRRVNAIEADRLRQEPMPLPTGKFAVIELDPPWSYEEQNLGAPGNRNAEDKYATMTLREIGNLPIEQLAAENCHLYLWTTANHLRHSWELLDRWGFEYRSIIVWHKTRIGMGHYYRNQAEFVLFGVKGRLPLLAHDRPNVYTWEAPRIHSAKPDGFYELVEECSPSPRIRLFARAQRDGWESWGNQA